jgi:hypothetical protein
MPSREEMIKKLRRKDMIDRLRSHDAKKISPAEDKPWYKSAWEGWNDLNDKVTEAALFGYSDEISGAIGAGIEKLKGSDESFGDLYEQKRDAERLRLEKIQERSPIASTVGTIAGSVVAPNPYGKIKGLAGLGKAGLGLAAEGAASGLGYSDADLNSMGAVSDAAIGGGLNVALPGAAGLAGKGVKKIAPEGVSALLKKTAQARATKAATGNQSKYSEPLRRKGKIEERGRVLLDEGVMDGSPAAYQISEKAGEASKKAWKDMEEVLDKVDELEPSAVDTKKVADKIAEYAASKDSPNNKAFVNKLLDQASDFEEMGSVPMAEAHRLKKQYKWDDRDPTTQSLGKEGTNKVNRILSDALEKAVEKVEKKGGDEISGLLDQYKSAKNRYGHLAGAAESSEKLASRHDKNRTFSLSDYLTGLGIAGGVGAGSGDTTGGLGVGAVAAMGNRALRRRGSAAASKALQRGSKMVEGIGDNTQTLQSIAKQGRPSLAATRAYMDATDKDYQQLIEDRRQRSEEEKKKQKMREILRDYYQLKKAN